MTGVEFGASGRTQYSVLAELEGNPDVAGIDIAQEMMRSPERGYWGREEQLAHVYVSKIFFGPLKERDNGLYDSAWEALERQTDQWEARFVLRGMGIKLSPQAKVDSRAELISRATKRAVGFIEFLQTQKTRQD